MNFSKRKAIQQKFVEWRLLNVLNVIEVAISSVIVEIQNLALQQNTEEKHSAYEISFAAGISYVDKFIIEFNATSQMCSRKESLSH